EPRMQSKKTTTATKSTARRAERERSMVDITCTASRATIEPATSMAKPTGSEIQAVVDASRGPYTADGRMRIAAQPPMRARAPINLPNQIVEPATGREK